MDVLILTWMFLSSRGCSFPHVALSLSSRSLTWMSLSSHGCPYPHVDVLILTFMFLSSRSSSYPHVDVCLYPHVALSLSSRGCSFPRCPMRTTVPAPLACSSVENKYHPGETLILEQLRFFKSVHRFKRYGHSKFRDFGDFFSSLNFEWLYLLN